MVGDLVVANHFCIFGCMKISKDQAYLILIMFKLQNDDRLVSDFVNFGGFGPNLKIGDLVINDDFGRLWLDDKRGWVFKITYDDFDDIKMCKISYDNVCENYESVEFNFFDYISFVDKI